MDRLYSWAESQAEGHSWAIVLAGGEGVRLRPLIRRVCGDERPKQYAALFGSRSLLGQTLERVALEIPRQRTVVVTHRAHAGYVAAEFDSSPRPRVLAQPEDRGTAAGLLFPAHWVSWQDPGAIIAAFPSDHFVLEAGLFMRHVMAVVSFVRRNPRWLVLLGARPTSPDTEYGWIEPGDPLGEIAAEPVATVRRFHEKPPEELARACFASGYLWNTFVLVGHVAALLELGRRCLPGLSDRLARIAPFAGTEDEPWAIRQAYALAPKANFSRAVLEACPASLVVSRLPRLTWSDWGTPERVLESLRRAGISPPWLTVPSWQEAGEARHKPAAAVSAAPL